MIKAIFFDIDGTLLSHTTNSVPSSTLEAINQLNKKGIYTFIATGRHKTEIIGVPQLENIPVYGYITLNGQYSYTKDKVLNKKAFSKEDMDIIIPYFKNHDIAVMFIEEEIRYMNFINTHVEKAQAAIHQELPETGDLNRGYDHTIYQVIPYTSHKEDIEPLLAQLPHANAISWHPHAFDVTPTKDGKEKGIEEVCTMLGVRQDEIMAFGDANNDESMIAYAGIGVAMGNASEELKNISDYVTDDIDHDGIYKALKHFHIL